MEGTLGPAARAHRRLIGQGLLYYASIYLFASFKFVAGFLIARILGPLMYGVRNKFGLVTEYEAFLHLGTFDAVEREVPMLNARGEIDRAERTLDTAFTAAMGYASCVGAAALLASLWMRHAFGPSLAADFTTFLAAWVFLAKVGEFFHAYLVTEKVTGTLSWMNGAYGAVNAVAGVALTSSSGLRGLFVALLIGETFRACAFIAVAPRMPRVRFDGAILRRLLRVGFPIMLIAAMFVVLRNVDRVVIAATLTDDKLGYFGVGTIVSGLVYLSINDLVRVMLYPRLMERVGSGAPQAELRAFLQGPVLMIGYLLPIVIAAIYFFIPLPIEWFLDEFRPSIRVTQLLILGSYYFAVVTVPIGVCIALGQQLRVVGLAIVAVVFNAALSVGLIRAGFDIDGVAVGTGISYLLFATMLLVHTLRSLGVPWTRRLRFYLLVNVPFALLVPLVHTIGAWELWAGAGPVGAVASELVHLVVFVVAFAPAGLLVVRDRTLREAVETFRPGSIAS